MHDHKVFYCQQQRMQMQRYELSFEMFFNILVIIFIIILLSININQTGVGTRCQTNNNVKHPKVFKNEEKKLIELKVKMAYTCNTIPRREKKLL